MNKPLSWTHLEEWLSQHLKLPLPKDLRPPSGPEIETDSRSNLSGKWFVALVGEHFDGHIFIEDVMQKGAIGFFCQESFFPKLPKPLQAKAIVVHDTLKALQTFAKRWRLFHPQVKIAALTGSCGKTTTKNMLGMVLESFGNTVPYAGGYRGNFNNEIGIPKALLTIHEENKLGVFELGARHVGDIAFLSQMVQADVACCLNAGMAHLQEFGSIAALRTTKLEIFSHNSPNALCVTCYDDEALRTQGLATAPGRTITFGHAKEADIQVTEVQWKDQGMTISIVVNPMPHITCTALEKFTQKEKFVVELPCAHAAYPVNIAAVTAMAIGLGVPLETISQALRAFRGLEGRYRTYNAKNLTVIDDSYNANPVSMAAGLSSLAQSYKEQKKVVILGDMLEIGPTSLQEHKNLGAFCLSKVKPNLLITVGKQANAIGEEAILLGYDPEKHLHFSSVDELIAKSVKYSAYGEVLYAKASLGVNLKKMLDLLL